MPSVVSETVCRCGSVGDHVAGPAAGGGARLRRHWGAECPGTSKDLSLRDLVGGSTDISHEVEWICLQMRTILHSLPESIPSYHMRVHTILTSRDSRTRLDHQPGHLGFALIHFHDRNLGRRCVT